MRHEKKHKRLHKICFRQEENDMCFVIFEEGTVLIATEKVPIRHHCGNNINSKALEYFGQSLDFQSSEAVRNKFAKHLSKIISV